MLMLVQVYFISLLIRKTGSVQLSSLNTFNVKADLRSAGYQRNNFSKIINIMHYINVLNPHENHFTLPILRRERRVFKSELFLPKLDLVYYSMLFLHLGEHNMKNIVFERKLLKRELNKIQSKNVFALRLCCQLLYLPAAFLIVQLPGDHFICTSNGLMLWSLNIQQPNFKQVEHVKLEHKKRTKARLHLLFFFKIQSELFRKGIFNKIMHPSR